MVLRVNVSADGGTSGSLQGCYSGCAERIVLGLDSGLVAVKPSSEHDSESGCYRGSETRGLRGVCET